jgi:hypothetical protein
MGQPLKRPFHNNLEKCTVVKFQDAKTRVCPTFYTPYLYQNCAVYEYL